AATFVIAAEQFIVFQTEHLDAHDQSFKTADKQIAEDHSEPVWTAALCSGELQHDFHDRCVADCKCTDTDERDRVGKVAQQGLKHLEEALNEEHRFALLHFISTFL